jgi:hypothetical protein
MSGAPPRLTSAALLTSLAGVRRWVEEHDYRGYEPFDGLSSWLRPLVRRSLLGERLLQQLIRQSPVNLRPILGVRPQDSTKGRGYMAAGYLLLFRATGDQEHLDKALACLRWLDQHKVRRFEHHSWSNHFDFASRSGGYTSDDPIIVWTALIAHAYVDAFEIVKDDWLLNVADSACKWIFALRREETPQGACISYLAHVQRSIHNANMLGASVLARTAKLVGRDDYLSVARSAMHYSCSRQRPDGSWWYAEGPEHRWIDNFHTGYNLDSLKHYLDATNEAEFRPAFDKGLRYFKDTFFEESGRPKYYHSRTYPVDIQCAAQAIDTLAFVADEDPESLPLAERVASWTINNMQSRKGYFYYRQYPLMTARTPMLHWGQATMFKALAQLALKSLRRNDR